MNTPRSAYRQAVREAVARALAEDRVEEDVTTLSVVPEGKRASARVFFREEGIVAGAAAATEAFRAVDDELAVRWSHEDGEPVGAGETAARVEGKASSILRAERVALNLLMHLSGIATHVSSFVRAARSGGAQILDTRKTTPGLRVLEKHAVRMGGGTNHRIDLASMVLLKENHLAVAGGVAEAVRRVRERATGLAIEVEVESLEELERVLPLGVDRVLLDNFSNEEIREAVARARQEEAPPYIEASGGIDLSRVGEVARLGVDGISIGALTHSAPALDLSLRFEEE